MFLFNWFLSSSISHGSPLLLIASIGLGVNSFISNSDPFSNSISILRSMNNLDKGKWPSLIICANTSFFDTNKLRTHDSPNEAENPIDWLNVVQPYHRAYFRWQDQSWPHWMDPVCCDLRLPRWLVSNAVFVVIDRDFLIFQPWPNRCICYRINNFAWIHHVWITFGKSLPRAPIVEKPNFDDCCNMGTVLALDLSIWILNEKNIYFQNISFSLEKI